MSGDLRSALNLLETACLSNESDMSTVNAYRVAVDNGIADLRAHVARLEESLRVALEARAEAVEVLRSLKERGPCPVCGSEGECYESCALARVLGRGE